MAAYCLPPPRKPDTPGASSGEPGRVSTGASESEGMSVGADAGDGIGRARGSLPEDLYLLFVLSI